MLTARATDDRGGVATSIPVSIVVTPPNNPPTVSLTSPLAGASFVAPAAISLAASADDSDGSVARVDYYQGATFIGSATAGPYALNWPGVPAGNYTLTAKARDNLGASTTSMPVFVTVAAAPPNNPPTVSLTSPAPGAGAYAPATLNLGANAADSDGSIAQVEFYSGTTLVGTATTAPFSFAWTSVPTGTYTLTAKATDNLGAATTSEPVTVSVQAQQLVFSAPAAGANLSGDSVLVKGSFNSSANSGITVNGQLALLDANNNFYAMVPLAAGANAITATMTSQSGQTATQSINVTSDGVAPPIAISADQVEGVQSLTVTFTLSGETPMSSAISYSGGSVTITQSGDAVIARYPAPGTYPTRFTTTDASGHTVVKDFVIVVQDAAQIDLKLKALWSGMASALVAGDKATAMNYMGKSAQAKYGPVFDVLMSDLPQIFSSFSALQSASTSSKIGEYTVNRTIDGVSRIFFIYFMRGPDGVWRLDSM